MSVKQDLGLAAWPPGWEGSRLGEIRRARGLHQRELGEAVGIDEPNRQARISNYECNKGRPSIETFTNLCVALDVTPNELLGVEEVEFE